MVVSELAAGDFGVRLVEEVVAYDSPLVVVVDLEHSVAVRPVSVDEAEVSVGYLRVCRSAKCPCHGEHREAQHDALCLAVGRVGAMYQHCLGGSYDRRAGGGCRVEVTHSIFLVLGFGVSASVSLSSASRTAGSLSAGERETWAAESSLLCKGCLIHSVQHARHGQREVRAQPQVARPKRFGATVRAALRGCLHKQRGLGVNNHASQVALS